MQNKPELFYDIFLVRTSKFSLYNKKKNNDNICIFFQKLNQSKYCADIGLLDPALFQRCFQFYSSVTEFLFMSLAQKTAAEEHKMKEFSLEDFDEGTYNGF